MFNAPIIVEIKEIIKDSPSIKTFIFDWDMVKNGCPNPGEFIMVWNFKDEKPMSVSIIDKENQKLGFTVKNIGEFTADLHCLKVGDKLGIRGFYGNGFNTDFKGKNVLAVGGGVGMAPINAIAVDLFEKGFNVDVISAAVTKDELLSFNLENQDNLNFFTCTDDGSCGYKGFANKRTKDLIDKRDYDMVFVCGPEIMMLGIFNLLEEYKISGQFSMERYMKCAIGICGQCCVDNTGWRICVEGPVFDNNQIKEIYEFGKYSRLASGVKKYY